MKGSPLPGSWNMEPLRPFNKFSTSPASAWEVTDGTLGTFVGQSQAHNDFAAKLREEDPEKLKASPSWKSSNVKSPPINRTPKRERRGIAGSEVCGASLVLFSLASPR